MIEETLSNTSSSHNSVGAKVLVAEIGHGEDDAAGEYPFRDLEWDELSRFDLGRPSVERNELVRCETIDSVHRQRQEHGSNKDSIGEGRPT